MGGSEWTIEEQNTAIEMAKQNASATEIAAQLPNRSRNAVIGFLHRKGIAFGKPRPVDKSLEELRRQTQRKMYERRLKLQARLAKVLQPPTRAQLEQSQTQLEPVQKPSGQAGVLFINRLPFQCAYIPGEVKGLNTRCCGKVVKGSSSWCDEHHGLMLVPVARKVKQSPTLTRERRL